MTKYPKIKINTRPVFFFMLCALLATGLISQCRQTEVEEETGPQASKASGEELSKIHCSSCHLWPAPELLSQATWEGYVLPRMGYMLGFRSVPDSVLAYMTEEEPAQSLIDQSGIMQQQPMLAEADWKKIRKFYLENAPDTLAMPVPTPIQTGLSHFKVRIPALQTSPAATSLIHFSDQGEIILGDLQKRQIIKFDKKLKVLGSSPVGEGPVWINERPDGLWVTIMGSLAASDSPFGFLINYPRNDDGGRLRTPAVRLQRPVHTDFGDLSGDGYDDIVICESGKWTGALSWWEDMGRGYQKHILAPQAGARKAYVRDLNQDGLADVIALFGQGDESIKIFYNQGDGRFRTETVLRFNPSRGSTSFQLSDFNQDGFPDLVCTAGENSGQLPTLQPQHGIRVFLNDGKNNFSEAAFFQLNGAYAAIPADFDLDGDLDIAAISFFPDFLHRPEESFVYLENTGDLQFKAATFQNPIMGRWMVMDSGDFDGDGDEDIALGSLALPDAPDTPPALNKIWTEDAIPFLVLENRIR